MPERTRPNPVDPLQVQIIGPYPPPLGGVQTHIAGICEELDARGHFTEMVAVPQSSGSAADPRVLQPLGRPHRLAACLRRSRAHIVHIHIGGDVGIKAIVAMLIILTFSHGKCILTFHSGGFVVSKRGRESRRHSLFGYIFRRFDRIICVNTAMREMFSRFGVDDSNTVLIYPFRLEQPDLSISMPESYREFAQQHEKLIVTVGLLEPEYDIELQIDAMEKILDSYPDTGLVIVGGGTLEGPLKAKVETKPYRRHIHIAGETERPVVLRIINDADLMIRTTEYDGDAISIREALFLSKPVIATDNQMRPRGVETVPVGDVKALSECVIRELSYPARIKDTPPMSCGNQNLAAVVDLYEKLAHQTTPKRR